MSGTSIQPTQPPTNQPLTEPLETPMDVVTRTLEDVQSLSGSEASQRLETIRGAVANGTLSGGLDAVQRVIRQLQERVAADVRENAPMATRTGRRANPRFERAIQNAYSRNHGSSGEFLAGLRREMNVPSNPDTAIRQALVRTSTHALEHSLVAAGASPSEAREIRISLEQHFSRRFEHAVADRVIEGLDAAQLEFAQMASDGPAFDEALARFVGTGTGGQTFLRAVSVLDSDTGAELSRLYNRMGTHPGERAAILQEMRGPFREAIRAVREQLIETREAALESFDSDRDSALSEFPGAFRRVADEWGLPRNMLGGRGVIPAQHGSVIAHGVRDRMVEVAERQVRSEALDGLVTIAATLLVPFLAPLVSTRNAVQRANDADHGAVLAIADVGDVDDAEADQAETDLEVPRFMYRVATRPAHRALTTQVTEDSDPMTGRILRQAVRVRQAPSD